MVRLRNSNSYIRVSLQKKITGHTSLQHCTKGHVCNVDIYSNWFKIITLLRELFLS